MKKNILKISAFILSLALLASLSLICASAENITGVDDGNISFATDYVKGDVNSDDNADVKDLVRLKKYVAQTEYNINKLAADINNDGKINSEDLTSMRQYLLGL